MNQFTNNAKMEDDKYVDECLEDELVENKIKVPEVGMTFDSLDELWEFYAKYGNDKGFPVKKRSSVKGDDGEVRWVLVACSRSGQSYSNSRNSFKMHPVSKTNCEAKMRAALCPDKTWRVTSVVLEHNHILSPGKSRYYKKNRKMGSYVKRRLEMNDRAGIRPKKSFSSFVVEAGGHENVPFLEKDCYNYLNKFRQLRLGEGDAIAIQNYFLKMQENNPNFFYLMDLDNEGILRNVFWADARSRAAYEEFGDAITFDTTYLTNKYDMPFAPFVGVNHHGHSILLGCALISSEDTETFTWLFKSWLSCMGGRAPKAIITDQDKAMKKAIGNVFPNTRHRWCLWHIMKKLPEKLRGYKQYESIKFAMQHAIYDSLTSEEFEVSWNMFILNYNLEKNEWLTGLYDERHRWVPTFVKDCFWAGMSTTQRSESMHAFFDDYVHSNTTLKQFVEQYENALRSKVQKENQDDFNSFNSWVPCITRYEIEKQFQDAYTTSKFKEFQKELTGKLYCRASLVRMENGFELYEVEEDMIGESKRQATFTVCFNQDECDIKCNCRLFEFKGILCRHALTVLTQKKIDTLPEKYILQRWKKNVKRCHTKVKIIYSDWAINPENQRFDKMCNAFFKVADLATDNEEKVNVVMEWIKGLTNELNNGDKACESSQPIQLEVDQLPVSSDGGDINPTRQSNKVRSPLAVRNKGRPPSNRKQPKLEKIVRKKKEKKKQQEKVSQMQSQIQTQIPFQMQPQSSLFQSQTHSEAQPQVPSWKSQIQVEVDPQVPSFISQIESDMQPQAPQFQPHVSSQIENQFHQFYSQVPSQIHTQVPSFQSHFQSQLAFNGSHHNLLYGPKFPPQLQGYHDPFWSAHGMETYTQKDQVGGRKQKDFRLEPK